MFNYYDSSSVNLFYFCNDSSEYGEGIACT
jgi:hypothetical protein